MRVLMAMLLALWASVGLASEAAVRSSPMDDPPSMPGDSLPPPLFRLFPWGAEPGKYTVHKGEWWNSRYPYPPEMALQPRDALVYLWTEPSAEDGDEPRVIRVDIWMDRAISELSKGRSPLAPIPIFSEFDSGYRQEVIARDALGNPISGAEITLHLELAPGTGDFLKLSGFQSQEDGRIPSVFFPMGSGKIFCQLDHEDYGTAFLRIQDKWGSENFPVVHKNSEDTKEGISGAVLLPDGSPAVGVSVTANHTYGRSKGAADIGGMPAGLLGVSPFVVTDEKGEFRYRVPDRTNHFGGPSDRPEVSGHQVTVAPMEANSALLPFQDWFGRNDAVVLQFPRILPEMELRLFRADGSLIPEAERGHLVISVKDDRSRVTQFRFPPGTTRIQVPSGVVSAQLRGKDENLRFWPNNFPGFRVAAFELHGIAEGYSVRGRAVDVYTGKPVAGAIVLGSTKSWATGMDSAGLRDEDWAGLRRIAEGGEHGDTRLPFDATHVALTKSDGSFHVPVIEGKNPAVYVGLEDHLFWTKDIGHKVKVTDDSIDLGDYALGPRARISFRVSDDVPLETISPFRSHVRSLSLDPSVWYSMSRINSKNPEGQWAKTFNVFQEPDDPRQLRLVVPADVPTTVLIDSQNFGPTLLAFETEFQKGEEVDAGIIELKSRATMQVTILGEDRRPIPGAKVSYHIIREIGSISNLTLNYPYAITDENGRVAFSVGRDLPGRVGIGGFSTEKQLKQMQALGLVSDFHLEDEIGNEFQIELVLNQQAISHLRSYMDPPLPP